MDTDPLPDMKRAVKPSLVPPGMPIVVGGSFMILLSLLALSKHLVRPHLHGRYLKPKRFSQSGADEWVLSQNQGKAGYFIDIGAFDKSGISNTRLLEEHQWQGICVDPMPHGFEERNCGYVPRPLGPEDGEVVDIVGCETISGILRTTGPTCAKSQVETMGVSFLMNMVEAPPVVDFLSMSVPPSMALRILKAFPFDNHCVRTWSIGVDNDQAQQVQFHRLFRQRKCRTKSGVADLWAQCSCGNASSSAVDSAESVGASP